MWAQMCHVSRGVHPSEAMMHFPLFHISPLFSDSVENFPNFTFSRKIFPFSSAKISDDLFEFPPYFACFSTFLSCFAEIIIPPPFFEQFPLFSKKFTCFLHTLCVF